MSAGVGVGRGPVVTVHVHVGGDTAVSRQATAARGTAAVVFDGAPSAPTVVLYAGRAELERLGAVLASAVADLDGRRPGGDDGPGAQGDGGGGWGVAW